MLHFGHLKRLPNLIDNNHEVNPRVTPNMRFLKIVCDNGPKKSFCMFMDNWFGTEDEFTDTIALAVT